MTKELEKKIDTIEKKITQNEDSLKRVIKGIQDNDETHAKIVDGVKKLISNNEIRLNNIQTWVILINVFGAIFGLFLYWLGNYEDIAEGFRKIFG
ncbi:MAG: hypothetical protein QM526_00595 [Alphaproteobacteria bacterium]|nr:hypothetical protein [Alphaproteobacteria bacterium]